MVERKNTQDFGTPIEASQTNDFLMKSKETKAFGNKGFFTVFKKKAASIGAAGLVAAGNLLSGGAALAGGAAVIGAAIAPTEARADSQTWANLFANGNLGQLVRVGGSLYSTIDTAVYGYKFKKGLEKQAADVTAAYYVNVQTIQKSTDFWNKPTTGAIDRVSTLIREACQANNRAYMLTKQGKTNEAVKEAEAYYKALEMATNIGDGQAANSTAPAMIAAIEKCKKGDTYDMVKVLQVTSQIAAEKKKGQQEWHNVMMQQVANTFAQQKAQIQRQATSVDQSTNRAINGLFSSVENLGSGIGVNISKTYYSR